LEGRRLKRSGAELLPDCIDGIGALAEVVEWHGGRGM